MGIALRLAILAGTLARLWASSVAQQGCESLPRGWSRQSDSADATVEVCCRARPKCVQQEECVRQLRLRGAGVEGSNSHGIPRRQRQPLSAPQVQAFDAVMRRRFFFGPSFEIYGGISGLYDYGPSGCAVKKGITAAWREHFVVEDGMLEVDCPAVTPARVLAASGHEQRFTDLMVRDELSSECFRADKLLEEACSAALARLANPTMRAKELQRAASARAASADSAQGPARAVAAVEAAGGDEMKRRSALEQLRESAASMGAGELDGALRVLNVTSPSTGAALSAAFPFNLMFGTAIGPRQVLPIARARKRACVFRPKARGVLIRRREGQRVGARIPAP